MTGGLEVAARATGRGTRVAGSAGNCESTLKADNPTVQCRRWQMRPRREPPDEGPAKRDRPGIASSGASHPARGLRHDCADAKHRAVGPLRPTRVASTRIRSRSLAPPRRSPHACVGIGRRRTEKGPRESSERGSDPGGGEAGDHAMYRYRANDSEPARGIASRGKRPTTRQLMFCRR